MRTTLLFILSLFVIGASAQLSGTYIIGSIPSDFLDLQEVRDTLGKAGTSSPVKLLMKPQDHGVFTVWWDITQTHRITIESQSGDTTNTSIILMRLKNCENIVIKNLTIRPYAGGGSIFTDQGSWLDRCKNVTIDSCLIVGLNQRYRDIGITITDADGKIKISNNTFKHLKKGVVFSSYSTQGMLGGHSGTNAIVGNKFYNVNTSIKLGGDFRNDTTLIAFNQIDSGEVGLQAEYVNHNDLYLWPSAYIIINGNSFYRLSSIGAIIDPDPSSNGKIIFSNNMLSGGSPWNTYYWNGQKQIIVKHTRTLILKNAPKLYVYNNSIWGALSYEGLNSISKIQNNAIYSDTRTALLFDNPLYTLRNNTVYSLFQPDSATFSKGIFSPISQVPSPGHDNFWANPHFRSKSDLHACSSRLLSAGIPNTLSIDFDGEPRSATTPDIGADEFKNSNIAPCAFYEQTCTDSSYTLTFTDSSPRSTSSFWKFSDGTSYTSKSFSKTFSGQETHTFKLISSNSYGRDSLESTVDFSSVAQQTISVQQNQVSIDTGYSYYQWYRDTIAIPGATKHFYQANTPGHYRVNYQNELGCTVWATNSPFLSLHESLLATPLNVKLYPNPASSVVNLSSEDNKIKYVEIVNLYGKNLMQKELNATIGSVSVENLAKGIYIFRIWLKDQKHPQDLKVEIL
ncbi:T9SS type A sorting domain-containing protein [Owenweeksia hongkongensis]|uniref:T9SS type A sorting domain-containing protein n=1 Tax=Owenweeksia hongkongensis TaxID=253245 RepID=UPI003A908E5F